MKKKTEKVWFDEQWFPMVNHLEAFINSGDQEELHQFRVQVKKVRAMLILLDITSPKHKLSRDFKPVRGIFKLGGNIRNAHINLQLGARYNLNNEEFITSQLYEIEKGINDFKAHGEKYVQIIKRAYRKIRNDLKAIENKEIVGFYSSNLAQVACFFSNVLFSDDLHDCRKQIKILLYNRKMANKALDNKVSLNYTYLDELQDVIGNWHDNVLALDLLSRAVVNDQDAIVKIKRQNIKLKKSITNLSQGFINKVNLPLNN